MCFENKIHALLKKYLIKKKESLYWCVGFLIWGLYIPAASSATSPAVRTLLIWLFYITHSLTLLTSLTHLLTHTYIYTLTRSHSLILTYTHSLSLTYSPIHSLTYTYLKTLTLTHSYSPTYTHIYTQCRLFLCGSRSQYTYPTTRTPWRPSGSASFAWKAWGNVYY